MSYILFDIGGTKTRVGVTEDLIVLGEVVSFKTPNNFEEGINAIVKAAKKLTKSPIRAVSGCIRGSLSGDKTGIIYDSVLSAWIDKSITETLKKKLKAEVTLENDAALAGLGEAPATGLPVHRYAPRRE